MKRSFVLLLILVSLTTGGCAEVFIGPLIGGPLGSAVGKAARSKPSPPPATVETPSTESR